MEWKASQERFDHIMELLKIKNRRMKSRPSQVTQELKKNYKWIKDLSIHLTKEDTQMVKKHMKRCSMSLTTRETQIKTIMRYHLIPVRMSIKKSTNNKCWRGCGGKKNPPTLLMGM